MIVTGSPSYANFVPTPTRTLAAARRLAGGSRSQVMADTLIEHVTGRPAVVPAQIAVNLVISNYTLLGVGWRWETFVAWTRILLGNERSPASTAESPNGPAAGEISLRPTSVTPTVVGDE
jgi:hypothetical protein